MEYNNCQTEIANCQMEIPNCKIEYVNCQTEYNNCQIEYVNCKIEYVNCQTEYINCQIEYVNCQIYLLLLLIANEQSSLILLYIPVAYNTNGYKINIFGSPCKKNITWVESNNKIFVN